MESIDENYTLSTHFPYILISQIHTKGEYLEENTLSTHFMKWVDFFSNPSFHMHLEELATLLFPQATPGVRVMVKSSENDKLSSVKVNPCAFQLNYLDAICISVVQSTLASGMGGL